MHTLKNPLSIPYGAKIGSGKWYSILPPGRFVSYEVANQMLEALKKIRDFDDDSEYDDPGEIAAKAIKKATT